MRVLDIGSGDGILAKLGGWGEGYVGLDQYDEAVKNPGNLDLRSWCWDDGRADPITTDGPYDLVVASGFLEYIDSREAFFKRVFEVLRPGGLFFTSMISDRLWLRRWRKFRGKPHRHPAWKTIVTPAAMGELFTQARFEVVAATNVINLWREWPGEAYSARRRWTGPSLDLLRPGAAVDQVIYEVRRPPS